MSRWADVDEVLEQIRKKLGIKSLSYLLEAERQIVDVIQSAPSIDIVFCHECKRCHYDDEKDLYRCTKSGMEHWMYKADIHYCDYGEREGE